MNKVLLVGGIIGVVLGFGAWYFKKPAHVVDDIMQPLTDMRDRLLAAFVHHQDMGDHHLDKMLHHQEQASKASQNAKMLNQMLGGPTVMPTPQRVETTTLQEEGGNE